jgi:hypothetical protein
VLADGAVVGRIMRANAAPVDAPWLWTVTFGHHEDRTPTHGYAVTREAAMTERVKAGRRRFVYRPCRKRTSHECLSDNQRLAKAVGLLRCRGKGARAAEARPADAGIVPGGASDICCEPTPPIPRTGLVALRGLSSEADYSFNAKGLDSQAAEPRFPRPDLRQRHQDRGESWPR